MAASDIAVSAADECEWEFTDSPPPEYDCPICQGVLREPKQVSCCGTQYCQDCIDAVIAEEKPCPGRPMEACGETSFQCFFR